MNDNIVKHACEVLGITQAELAKRIGIHEVTVRQWSSKGTPANGEAVINLLLENHRLQQELSEVEKLIEGFVRIIDKFKEKK